MLCSRIFPLAIAALFCAAAAAQTPLEVVSADLNASTRQITVTLVNHSAKTVVAYALDIAERLGRLRKSHESSR